jgi:hypothetical protein
VIDASDQQVRVKSAANAAKIVRHHPTDRAVSRSFEFLEVLLDRS